MPEDRYKIRKYGNENGPAASPVNLLRFSEHVFLRKLQGAAFDNSPIKKLLKLPTNKVMTWL